MMRLSFGIVSKYVIVTLRVINKCIHHEVFTRLEELKGATESSNKFVHEEILEDHRLQLHSIQGRESG